MDNSRKWAATKYREGGAVTASDPQYGAISYHNEPKDPPRYGAGGIAKKVAKNLGKFLEGSKVVDEAGKPKVVYHGTTAREDFKEFNPASFFTDSPKEASAYTMYKDIQRKENALNKYKLSNDTSHSGKYVPYTGVLSDVSDPKVGNLYATDNGVFRYLGDGRWEGMSKLDVDYNNYDDKTDSMMLKKSKRGEAVNTVKEHRDWANKTFTEGQRGRVYPVYLDIKNPVELGAMEANVLGQRLGADKELIQEFIDKYAKLGYDGIVTKSDEAKYFPDVRESLGGIPTQYIPFKAEQIKSAIGNAGTYDPNVKDITKAGGGLIKKAAKATKEALEREFESAPKVSRIDMNYKDVTKRIPELTEAARLLDQGLIDASEYDKLVNALKPVEAYDFVPEPASFEDAMRALTKNKQPMYGKTSEIPAGEQTDLRLDIPAYKDHGVWVNSVHRKDAPTVYGSVSSVKNATMIGSPEKAFKVAKGETPKAPFAVIRGEWSPLEQEEAVKRAQAYLNDPEWVQVGYDPERHGYFYGRHNMQPIEAAEEVIQIGPLVLAKNPKYAEKAKQKYAGGGLARKVLKGAVEKAVKEKKPALPLDLTRAKPKTAQEITKIADRVARQQSGEFVRKSELSGKADDTANLAGRSGKEVKRLKDIDYTLERTKDIRPTPTYESKVGDVNIAIPGDQTIADFRLVDVNGRPIDSTQQGGSMYGEGKLDLDDPLFWASEEGVAQMLQDKITELAKLYNTDRVTAYHLAMGQDANNFAMHFADANLKAIANSDLSPEAIEIFNAAVREGPPHPKTGKKIPMPHFAGIENPEEAYMQMLENPMLRKWFNNRMKVDKYTTKVGLPSGKDIQWAITEPALRNMEINLTGHSVGRMKPFAELTDTADHVTYSKGIQGESLGRAPELAPFEMSFPDADLYLRSVYAPSDLTGTMQKVFPHQVVDQQQLDQMSEYYRRLREIRGFAKGGSANLEDEFRKADTIEKKPLRAIPQAVISALDKGRKLSPIEKKLAGSYADPESQWKLGSILEELDPVFTAGRGAEALKNVDYGAIRDLALQRYQLSKNPRKSIEKGLENLGEATFGALDVAPVVGAVASKTGRNAIKSLAKQFEGAPAGLSIKPVGGQWFPRGVESELEDVKMADTESPVNKAVNAWVDGTLRKYLMNRMGTENDEVRKLFDEGIHHVDPSNLNLSNYVEDLEANRRHNYYGKQIAKTSGGKKWEDASDSAIFPRVAGNLGSHVKETYPWINKLPPEEKIYALSSNMENNPDVMRNLGFDHVIDVLKSDILEGKLRPEQLNKVSVEDAIKRTHNYNIEMAKKAEEAGIMTHQGMPIHREYPEGYKWVELKYSEPTDTMPEGFRVSTVDYGDGEKRYFAETPNTRSQAFKTEEEAQKELEGYQKNLKKFREDTKTKEALNYEGESMGHCVGSYCEDVIGGNTRIFSLRDAEGKPHVTVEVTAQDAPAFYDVNKHHFESNPELQRYAEFINDTSSSEAEFIDDVTRKMKEMGIEPVIPEPSYKIQQIKGKGNAKPADKYIPYVQDFVKNPVVDKNWADVGDFRNTNLLDARRIREHGVVDSDIYREIEPELERIYQLQYSPSGLGLLESEHGRLISPDVMLKNQVQDLTGPYITKEDIINHLRSKEALPIEQSYSKYYETPNEEGMASGGSVNYGRDAIKRLVDEFSS